MTYYEAVLNFNAPTGAIKNVLHYLTAAEQGEQLQAATDEIELLWNTHFRSQVAPSITFNSITWRVDEVGAVGIEYPVPLSPVAGSATSSEFAAAEALILHKKNTTGTKPARGRMYIGGVTSGKFNSVGNWDQSVLDAGIDWLEAIAEFTAGSPATVFNMVIKASNLAAPNTVPYAVVDTVGGVVRPGTQRRRRRGIGV